MVGYRKVSYGPQFLSFQLTIAPQQLEMAPLEQKSAVVDGTEIAYQSDGNGAQALVVIHGWPCNSSLWYLQAPLFQRYRSLLIDLPGMGTVKLLTLSMACSSSSMH